MEHAVSSVPCPPHIRREGFEPCVCDWSDSFSLGIPPIEHLFAIDLGGEVTTGKIVINADEYERHGDQAKYHKSERPGEFFTDGLQHWKKVFVAWVLRPLRRPGILTEPCH